MSQRRGLAAAGRAQLGQDVGHVHAHRLGRDEQLAGDRGIAQAGGDQAEHLELARGQAELGAGERDGPLVPIEVTPEALERALLLADQLLRSADTLGWSFIESPSRKEEETHVAPAYGRHADPPPPAPPKQGELF